MEALIFVFFERCNVSHSKPAWMYQVNLRWIVYLL